MLVCTKEEDQDRRSGARGHGLPCCSGRPAVVQGLWCVLARDSVEVFIFFIIFGLCKRLHVHDLREGEGRLLCGGIGHMAGRFYLHVVPARTLGRCSHTGLLVMVDGKAQCITNKRTYDAKYVSDSISRFIEDPLP